MASCTGGEKKELQVIDLRESELPDLDAASYHPGDVQIFRSSYLGDSYAVRMYVEEEGETRAYQSYIMSTQNFDQATYQWQDDATLHLILLSSENGQVGRYSLTCENGKVELKNFS